MQSYHVEGERRWGPLAIGRPGRWAELGLRQPPPTSSDSLSPGSTCQIQVSGPCLMSVMPKSGPFDLCEPKSCSDWSTVFTSDQ